MVQEILLLGEPRLYEVSQEVKMDEISELEDVIQDLHDTLFEFRRKYGAGRAIAAPQIGVMKRVIYMFVDEPITFINPRLVFPDQEMMEVMDDCMSFPHLLVRVNRYKRCKVRYQDLKGKEQEAAFEGDLAELIQHEYDHLDGILATMRAVDEFSFFAK